jgi:hypothetical protein
MASTYEYMVYIKGHGWVIDTIAWIAARDAGELD